MTTRLYCWWVQDAAYKQINQGDRHGYPDNRRRELDHHSCNILAIGIIAGLVFNRYGRSWLGRQTAGATGIEHVSYALVGIAGSFIGFHIAVILGLLPAPLMLHLCALAGAVITIWLWRGR